VPEIVTFKYKNIEPAIFGAVLAFTELLITQNIKAQAQT
jgi:hypothetical protein